MSKCKYTKEFRKSILNSNYCKQVAQMRKRAHEFYNYTNSSFMGIDTLRLTMRLLRNIKEDASLDCACRLNDSAYRKAKKVRDKITDIVLSNNAYFITLTFNDTTLSKTDVLKRRRLVQRYLKDNCSNYAANIDFGGKKGREHYHAVCDCPLVLNDWHKYGAIQVKYVRPCDKSTVAISKYITKLTAHALKNKDLDTRLIYSRNVV